MYISADVYEDVYLKGKDEAQIEAEVKKMRDEIAKLKYKLESPFYKQDPMAYPPEDSVVSIYRNYLFKAADALKEKRGVATVLTEEERAAKYIDSNSDKITSITLTIGEHFENKYELSLGDFGARLRKWLPTGNTEESYESIGFVKELLCDLHLGEWRESYSAGSYGISVNEAVKWQLRIDYDDDIAPRFHDGIGVFPYNFRLLAVLLEVEY